MKVPFLDLARQTACLRGEIEAAMARVLDRARFILDEEVEAFEREWTAFCGARDAVGVANGTQAIEIALRACGVGAGHEVITSPLTAPFTATAICATGAAPIFADVDPETLLLDPLAAERKITPRTRAMIPVHLYGRVADMQSFSDIGRRRKLEIIQDACQAHGSVYAGKPLTAWSRWVAFSFYPTKNLGALGDGGALVTDDSGLAAAARLIRNGGVKTCAVSERPAINSRLDEMQAAILRAKLTHLRRWNARRGKIAEMYAARLSPPAGGQAPPGEHVFHLYVIRSERRSALRQQLERAGVGTSIHYPQPLHLQPAFGSESQRGKLPIVERACHEIVSLPLYPELDDREIDFVISSAVSAVSAVKSA